MVLTLYKLDSKNRLRIWKAELKANTLVIRSGLEKGRKTVTVVNGDSLYHDLKEEMRRRADKKMEREGYTKEIPSTAPFSPMLAKEYIPGQDLPLSFFLQPKLDGVRCLLTSEGPLSRKKVPILSIPHIPLPPPGTVVDGEIYVHGKKLQEISGMSRRHYGVPELEYHVFDTYIKSYPNAAFPVRLNASKYTDHPSVKFVETIFGNCEEHINTMFTHCLEEGYEGVMIRDPNAPYHFGRTSSLLKHKATNTETFRVLYMSTGPQNKVVATCSHPNGEFDTILLGSVDEQRYWLNNPPNRLTVKYAGLTKDGLPYHARAKVPRSNQ